MKEISVGIDLGTTNSSISTCWPEGQPRLLRDEEGSGIIPSVVSFTEKGSIIVGQKARQSMLTDLENTFYSIKRFMGRDMRKPENQYAAAQYPFNLESGVNGVPIAVTHGKKFPIHQISGFILKHLIEMADNSTGQKVKKAVITVPANFNESQRKATKQAGEFAGLEVLRIFNEPTAAALAYGLGKTEKEVVAIYDFGGGTFDITILRLEDPVFEVLATAGDTMLGGDDMDRLILQDMLELFQDQYGFAPEADSALLQRFLFGAERMKCQLSDWIVTAFEDRHVKDADGKPLKPFHYELNRERFKKITSQLGEKSLTVCEEVLRTANVNTTDVSQVVLVGGTTRIPYLRKMVENFFGRPPLDKIQPDVVVSIGASIQAFSLAGGETVYPASDKDMLPKLSHKRILPRPKQMLEADFDERLDLSDEVEAEEDEGEPARDIGYEVTLKAFGNKVADSLSKPFEDTETLVKKSPLEQAEASVRKSEPPGKQKEVTPPALKLDTDDLELVTPTQSPSPGPSPDEGKGRTLLDALRKTPDKPQEPLGRKDLPAPKKPLPLPVPGMDKVGGSDVDELLKSQKVPDIQVVPTKKKEMPPETKPLALALEDLQKPPAPVTPESVNEPYIPKDILKQMDEVHQKEIAEEEGEIASVGPGQIPSERKPQEKPKGTHAPLLLDVTPSTLGVATVGGFTEVIIKKNSPVPIGKSHIFTTSADYQEKVIVRILEGESKRADENNELGMFELFDIRPAPRGEIKIEVTFDISVDGILEIAAKNLETKKAQKTKLTLFGT